MDGKINFLQVRRLEPVFHINMTFDKKSLIWRIRITHTYR